MAARSCGTVRRIAAGKIVNIVLLRKKLHFPHEATSIRVAGSDGNGDFWYSHTAPNRVLP